MITAGYFEALAIPLVEGDPIQPPARRLAPRVDQSDHGALRLARSVGHRASDQADQLRSRWPLVHRRGHRRRYAIYGAGSCASSAGLCPLRSGSARPDGGGAAGRSAIRSRFSSTPHGGRFRLSTRISRSPAFGRWNRSSRRRLPTGAFRWLLIGIFALLAVRWRLLGCMRSCRIQSQNAFTRWACDWRSARGRRICSVSCSAKDSGWSGWASPLAWVRALLLTRFLEALLFGVDARDMTTFVLASAVLLGAGCWAAWRPARRAMRVDPAIALRAE